MTSINGVDVGNVVQDALKAAKAVGVTNWTEIKDILKNIADSLLVDLKYIAQEKLKGKIDEYSAKIFLEDQKMVARIRLRSLAIITLQSAERLVNAILDVFKAAANKALGWNIF